MKYKPQWLGTGVCGCMLILILDGQTAVTSAQAAVELCLKTVIPSLFPFFVLSPLLLQSLSGNHGPFRRVLRDLLDIPAGAEPILISGFLGGYPLGAQSIGLAYREGRLSKADAHRLLLFCCNAGPAFLFGMVSPLFSDRHTVWLLWGVHIGSAVLTGQLFPGKEGRPLPIRRESALSVSRCMNSAIHGIACVCGWVVVFRVLLGFLDKWFLWLLPAEVRILLMGLLELTNGCCALGEIADPALRFLLCSLFLSFGGLCVTLQTASVLQGLSLKYYLTGKLLQTAFTLLLCLIVLNRRWYYLLPLLLLTLIPKILQKNSSIPADAGV